MVQEEPLFPDRLLGFQTETSSSLVGKSVGAGAMLAPAFFQSRAKAGIAMYIPMTASVGNHRLWFQAQTSHLNDWVARRFKAEIITGADVPETADLSITIYDFYGSMYDGSAPTIEQGEEGIVYTRVDYKLVVSSDYRHAIIYVYDDFALKHAMINVYSAFLIHYREGLLIHSSCVVENGKAWMFAGPSGAGKSTVAELSSPRPVLSDEATYLRVESDGSVTVFDSPFRSELEEPCELSSSKLAGIHFLNQSLDVRRAPISKSDALMGLVGKVFYWRHDRQETAKMLALCSAIVSSVPAYQLYFQKNDTFWERIS
jgi:hypothetical protein